MAVFSVHQSKGREAKHVVLLHAVTGPFGFPPDERNDELIAPVQEVETNTVAEERRLFYVAITRAERDLHVLTRTGEESPFVEEIEPYLKEKRSVAAPGTVGDRTTLTAQVKLLWDNTHETQHQRGVLEDDTGTTTFVSWKNDDPADVDENVWYQFENLRVDEFNDDRQLVIDSETDVTELYR